LIFPRKTPQNLVWRVARFLLRFEQAEPSGRCFKACFRSKSFEILCLTRSRLRRHAYLLGQSTTLHTTRTPSSAPMHNARENLTKRARLGARHHSVFVDVTPNDGRVSPASSRRTRGRLMRKWLIFNA
jgi:hypothetical protein